MPEHLDVGEGYGQTSWNVRAIWEMYAGWFQHRSTTEFYGVAPVPSPPTWCAPPADALVEAARTHLVAGRPVQALQLTDLVLAAEPTHCGGACDGRRRPRGAAGRDRQLLEKGLAHQTDQRIEDDG